MLQLSHVQEGQYIDKEAVVTKYFGPMGNRNAIVIAGAGGVVGWGKAIQLCRNLLPYGVPIIVMDFPSAPFDWKRMVDMLKRKFSPKEIALYSGNIIHVSNSPDGFPAVMQHLPSVGMVFEAIVENRDLKRGFYAQCPGSRCLS